MNLLSRILRRAPTLEVGEGPRSVAIIMDGNNRWAAARGLPVEAGHREGTRALRRTVEAAIDLNIEALAVYAFSTENWLRPPAEVDALMEIFGETIRRELWIAFDYGGRAELAEAARRIVEGGLAAEEIDEDVLAAHLYAPDLPEPDLLIRTSGELRISNFLLWQLAYSELVFTARLWPEFGADDLRAAVQAYAGRNRRFGAR